MDAILSDFNAFEALLWLGCAGACLYLAFIHTERYRVLALVTAFVFVLFGLSDLVERETGAWWRPWWLLVWKALCVGWFLSAALLWRKSTKWRQD